MPVSGAGNLAEERLRALSRWPPCRSHRSRPNVHPATVPGVVVGTLPFYLRMIRREPTVPGPMLEWRMRNIGRLLLRATDAFVTEKLREVHGSGLGPVGQVHFALIQNIDFDGTRLTLAAARARMTKQSMLELVDRAERLGLVERRPDPADGRAKVIAFTPGGLQMMGRLKDGIAEAERHMATIIGAAFMARMRRKLTGYVIATDGADRATTVQSDAAWRTHNTGRVLGSAFGAFTRDVQRSLHESGFAEISEVHMTLFRNLDVQGTRPTEIAARARMTKQAMTDLVRKTERLGLVRRGADPTDGRALMVVPTPKGLRLFEQTRIGIERAESRMADLVGKGFFSEIKRTLPVYVAGVAALSHPATDPGKRAQAGRRPAGILPDEFGLGSTPQSSRVMRAG